MYLHRLELWEWLFILCLLGFSLDFLSFVLKIKYIWMTFPLRGKITGDEQLVEWTNILSKIKLQTDNQNKDNKTARTHVQETTKEIKMSKEVRQGRRAGTNTANQDDDDLLDSLVSGSDSGPIPPDDMPPRPSRRQGGWASETTKEKKKITGQQDVEAFEEDERFRMDNTVSKDDDNDILVIPDLEEVQEEDMATQIAAPPSVQVNRVATYRELDNYLQKHAALFTLDGEIDLKLLSNVLSPETEVFEEDKAWDWNRLFTEVASELQSEWDRETEGRSESTEKT